MDVGVGVGLGDDVGVGVGETVGVGVGENSTESPFSPPPLPTLEHPPTVPIAINPNSNRNPKHLKKGSSGLINLIKGISFFFVLYK